MKLIEICVYAIIVTLVSYILLAVGLRIAITDTYIAHMIAGIGCVVLGVGTFMFLLLKKD